MLKRKILEHFRIEPGERFRLKDYNPAKTNEKALKALGKDELKERAQEVLQKNLQELHEAQATLWAHDTYSVLIILQAMDAAGKDGVIRHVMSGVNPQGCRVQSFKQPSSEELDHDFLWRAQKAMQRFPESRDALAKALALAPDDLDVMVELAESRALSSPDRRLDDESRRVLTLLDGARNARAIATETGLTEEAVRKAIHTLERVAMIVQ